VDPALLRSYTPAVDRTAYLTALCRTVPYHIVEAVLSKPTERAIDSHEVFDGTVMFADVVGFTPMCERLANSGANGLSELTRVLNGLFESMLEDAIFPYSGYVVHFGGDSCTTFFRGPDHALRAAAAALTAQRLMFGEVGRLLTGKSRELMMRVGLAAGETRLPILGDLSQRGVVCAGPTAHRALEMEEHAEPNTIVADASVLGQLGGVAEVVDRHSDWAVLRGLHSWPEGEPIRKLPPLDRDTDAKIALLEPFVPAPLAGRLRTTPKDWRIEGELRPAVIAFAELWGLDEGPPDMDVSTNVSRSLLRAFRKYGGVLAKADLARRGHRIMILFGLHRPSENDSERALLASLEATARLKAFTVSQALGVSIRIGVHAGPVYYGAIGSAHKHDITVVGDAVNVAARAAAAAEPFEVMVTDTVLSPLSVDFEHSSRGPVAVKGKSDPIELHVVHAAAEGAAHYVSKRKHSRFLAGRDDERGQLESAVESAAGGNGQVIGLCGERGTGKSALLAEMIDRWSERGAILGRCRYAASSTPLAPVMTMFQRYLGITAGDSEADRRERIRTGLGALDLERGAPELVSLLQPVQRPDGSNEALIDLANNESREAVIASMVEFVKKRLKQEPLLYVLEDLHLADSMTMELAVRLTLLPADLPALLVATYRPVAHVAEFRRNLANETELGDISIEAVEQLTKHELNAESLDSELLVFLWQRTGGNPGHVLEVLRFLTERGLLRLRAGVAGPAPPGIQLLDEVVPTTLTQVALSRIDELATVERRLLRVASAIGRRFTGPLLEEAATEDVEAETVVSAMAGLEGHGVIVPSAHEDHGFMFRDSVTRAVAYGTIPDAERRNIHQHIADAMERLHAVGHGPTAAMLALHRERAGQHVEAVRWYERAARGAMRAGLVNEVAYLAERWEAMVAELDEDDRPDLKRQIFMAMLRFVASARRGAPAETLELGRALIAAHKENLDDNARVTIDHRLGQALMALGKPEKAQGRLERAFARATDTGVRTQAARLLARAYGWAHAHESAAMWLERATEAAGEDPVRLVRVAAVRGELAVARGDMAAAMSVLKEAREQAHSLRRTSVLGEAALLYGRCLTHAGEFDLARTAFEEALGAYRSTGRWRAEAMALLGLGQAFLWAGQLSEARHHLERGLAIAQDVGDVIATCDGQVNLGAAIAWTRDPNAGRDMCEEGARQAVRSGMRNIEVTAELHLLRSAILEGDLEAARAAARRCTVQAHHMNTPLLARRLQQLTEEADAMPHG